MPELLDERGNLFGLVNVVDALVVLLVLAIVVAGAALVLGESSGGRSGGTADTSQTVVYIDYRSEPVEPYVADAVPEGRIGTANINSIENKTIAPADTVTQNESGALSVRPHPINRTVTFRVELNVTEDGGEYLYDGTPLEVGTTLSLDVGPTRVSGHVTAVEPDEP